MLDWTAYYSCTVGASVIQTVMQSVRFVQRMWWHKCLAVAGYHNPVTVKGVTRLTKIRDRKKSKLKSKVQLCR